MGDWYFERWKPDGERPIKSEVTRDFEHVFAQCQAALLAGEIFRVRPPVGVVEQMQELGRLGKVERI
ncbi:MAG: hypothetical protein ABI697_11150 [Devosia sp.]